MEAVVPASMSRQPQSSPRDPGPKRLRSERLVCVCAFLRKHAARELEEHGELEKQVIKCLQQFATGSLEFHPRDGCNERYARLNGKRRIQFVRADRAPPKDTYCSVLRAYVPAHLVRNAAAGLHVSLIYTSDKGNKLYKKLRGKHVHS